MKIAIKINPTRGEEIIKILSDLGGKPSLYNGNGTSKSYCYFINEKKNNKIDYDIPPTDYKVYTLEEFEKEFPFKVGDLCVYHSYVLGEDIIVKILGMTIEDDCVMYEVDHKDSTRKHSYNYKKRNLLKPYKEMKEERNVTLTIDKAKEWYKKGGELREIALQAFTEKELNPLPRNWEEFCEKYSKIDDKEYFIDSNSSILQVKAVVSNPCRLQNSDRNICPSVKSAEAHLAMMQLEQLRDCWRQGWKPDKWNNGYCIVKYPEKYVVMTFGFTSFLSFPTKKMAEEFIECFRDLMEKAGDLI